MSKLIMSDQQHTYSVKIPKGKKIPNGFEAEFGRINIILGINGSGKSAILEALKDNHNKDFSRQRLTPIYIEGGRKVEIHDLNWLRNRHNPNPLPFDIDAAQKKYESKTKENLSHRFDDALRLLMRKQEQFYQDLHDKADQQDNRQYSLTEEDIPPLKKLFGIFSDIFKEIKIEFNSKIEKIECKKNDSESYSLSGMSDGEKQVFCLIVELLFSVDNNDDPLIFVDEPELNMHPALAIDFWRAIENKLPNAVFVYATHLINFCTRPEVDALLVLSQNGEKPLRIKDPQHPKEIDRDELRTFLGAIPSILTTSKMVIIEGKDDSVDNLIYPWLLKDTKASFAPVGSSSEVKSAVKRDGVWQALGDSLKIFGIIDSDFKPVNKIHDMEKSGVLTLPFHEVESILLLPKVACLVAERKRVVEPPSENKIEDMILKEWGGVYPEVVLKRIHEQIQMRVAPAVSGDKMAEAKGDVEILKQELLDNCEAQSKTVLDHLDVIAVSSCFDNELQKCKNAFDSKNIAAILTLMPAKKAATEVARLIGFVDEKEMARAVTKHISVDEIPELVSFRAKLIAKLGS